MSKAVADMYDTGVLVENPIYATKYFQNRMGYKNPDVQATNMVDTTQNGFQAKWRGQTFEKRELVAGVHNGEMPGSETNTDILQARAMNPWSAKATSRMDYLNPSWQANVSQFGGNSGTIEMLAGNYSQPLPMAMDNLEQISANAIDEDKRLKRNDPLSNTYVLEHMGLEELLAIDRGNRLAQVRGRDSQMQDVTIDTSKQDLNNSYNTTYQGPSIKTLTSYLNNPVYDKVRRDRKYMRRTNAYNVERRLKATDISTAPRPVSTGFMSNGVVELYQGQLNKVAKNFTGTPPQRNLFGSSSSTFRSTPSTASSMNWEGVGAGGGPIGVRKTPPVTPYGRSSSSSSSSRSSDFLEYHTEVLTRANENLKRSQARTQTSRKPDWYQRQLAEIVAERKRDEYKYD